METTETSDVRRVLTDEQLRRGAEGLSYRSEQLAFITMLGPLPPIIGAQRARVIWNARIESVLIHGRALAYFLRSQLPSTNDLHYSHYSKSAWKREAKKLNEVATKTIDQAAGRLTHASIGHPDWEPHPGQWPLAEIASVFCFSLRDFVMQLEWTNPERAALFGDRPADVANAIAGQFPGFTRTPLSDHPEIADLTRSLQSFMGFE